jgi:hypothetical protein
MSSNQPLHLVVLRAALRCARHRRAADRAALLVRVDCSDAELDVALTKLAGDGLIHACTEARLTMQGLAVALAVIATPARAVRAHERARSAA